jgi:hypothetical protein
MVNQDAWRFCILGKVFPALFGALTMVVVWKAIEELKGGLFACVLASLGLLFSYYSLNMLYQPNSTGCPVVDFFYILIKYVNTEK